MLHECAYVLAWRRTALLVLACYGNSVPMTSPVRLLTHFLSTHCCAPLLTWFELHTITVTPLCCQILDREMIRREVVGEELIGVSTRKKREVALGDLRKVKTLGTGTFGRVKLVQHKETKEVFALKCMMKAQVKCCITIA
jgi:hypothetical protein